MSSETLNPISPTAFASALKDLPLDALHSKAAELENSLTHLRFSNEQMLPFAESGDQDCKDAMVENLGVIARVGERIGLIRGEVEGRGVPWTAEGEEGKVNGVGSGDIGHGDGEGRRAESGRLTDEELRRRMEVQIGEDGDGAEDDGVHL